MNISDFEDLKFAIMNRGLTDAGLAIHGANFENVLTAAARTFLIDNVFYSLAAQAEIDLSTLTGLPTDALATGYTQVFALYVNAAGTISVGYGNQILTQNITDGTQVADFPGDVDGKNLFGYIKVGNASGSDFTLGTTLLSAAGITDTYYDVAGAVDSRDEL